MNELTVRDTKPITGGGKHIWAGPLGTTKPSVSKLTERSTESSDSICLRADTQES